MPVVFGVIVIAWIVCVLNLFDWLQTRAMKTTFSAIDDQRDPHFLMVMVHPCYPELNTVSQPTWLPKQGLTLFIEEVQK